MPSKIVSLVALALAAGLAGAAEPKLKPFVLASRGPGEVAKVSMMGAHSFMKIRCAPDSIEGALKQVVAKM